MQNQELNELAARLIWDVDIQFAKSNKADHLSDGDIFLMGIDNKVTKAKYNSQCGNFSKYCHRNTMLLSHDEH